MNLRHRRHEVGRRFRFGHVPSGSGTQRLNGQLSLRVHADDQHAHLGETLLELPQQGEEPGPGHADVQDQHVRAAPVELSQQIVSLGRLAHDPQRVVLGGELAEAGANQVMIVGDEDPDHAPRGIVRVKVVPAPGAPVTVTFPRNVVARSRMPSRPSERESCRAPSRMPRPLSWTVNSRALGETPRRTSTWVAAAWRATLVSASWKMRNTAVARLASRAGCSWGSSTRHSMPVRVAN